jgi:fructoselysine 3-epimerase
MKTSLFSQSLYALPLGEAIEATARAGYEAIEIACARPHFEPASTQAENEQNAAKWSRAIRSAGLRVSALSLFTELSKTETLQAQLARALGLIRLCPIFDTLLVKVTPGGPASAAAAQSNWDCLARGLEALTREARALGIRLAFETHMRQLTDTLAGSLRLVKLADKATVGLTVDYSNLAFAGERFPEAATALLPHTFHTHVKNGTIDAQGGWHFGPLDQGLTDYRKVLPALKDSGYQGYLSVECLGKDAQEKPRETIARDLEILRRFLGAQ